MIPQPRVVRLALLGYGTVGQALVRLVASQRERLRDDAGLDLVFSVIANRRIEAKPTRDVPAGARLTDDLAAAATATDVDLVVELVGGLEPAGTLVRAALEAGKPVVTANKLLLAERGAELAALAAEKGVGIGLEASVAGGIPILRALRESFASDRVLALSGIVNGTCNYILTRMDEDRTLDYGKALAEAQAWGYAEADPTADVEGLDAASKLVLLSRMAFGQEATLAAVSREGITRLLPYDFLYAEKLDRRLRLLATGRRIATANGDHLSLSVRTHLVPKSSFLGKIEGPLNAVQVTCEAAGDFVFTGKGAGGDATAMSVLADVIALARTSGTTSGDGSGSRGSATAPPFGFARLAPLALAGPEEFRAPFYLRFVVDDAPGILAAISQALAAHRINIDAVFQIPWKEKKALPFVITLEETTLAALEPALEAIRALPFHVEPPLALPMTS